MSSLNITFIKLFTNYKLQIINCKLNFVVDFVPKPLFLFRKRRKKVKRRRKREKQERRKGKETVRTTQDQFLL